MKFLFAVACVLLVAESMAEVNKEVIQVGAFTLPRYSDYLSSQTRSGLERSAALNKLARSICDPTTRSNGADIRACETRMYAPIMKEARELFAVTITDAVIGGVQTDIVMPSEGLAGRQAGRVLINVHGGAFKFGARFGGQLEAMPLAALAKYKVVAVDYRMSPEHQFPAASMDVIAVYVELLKQYPPSAIGLYGCSAGGRIVGQAVARLDQQNLPRPGAIAILCSPPTRFGGDSNIIVAALQGSRPLVRRFDEGYFKGVNPQDPLAFPGDFDQVLARFPPTLLMTSTRDYSLSSMVQMHSRLVNLDVPAELHVFEGLRHGEFLDMHTPESRRAAKVLASFFERYLRSARDSAAEAAICDESRNRQRDASGRDSAARTGC